MSALSGSVAARRDRLCLTLYGLRHAVLGTAAALAGERRPAPLPAG